MLSRAVNTPDPQGFKLQSTSSAIGADNGGTGLPQVGSDDLMQLAQVQVYS